MRKIELNIFGDFLSTLAKDKKLQQHNLAVQPAMKGNANIELYVLGRALNGWGKNVFDVNKLENEDYRKSILRSIHDNTLTSQNCLDWLQEYPKYRKSQFWNLIERIIKQLAIDPCGLWWHHIIWSNLFKCAPSRGGNPSQHLMKLQYDTSISILKHELEIWQPKRMIFIVGKKWLHDFNLLEKLQINGNYINNNSFVQFVGNSQIVRDGKIVVTARPEGRSFINYVPEICKHFS